MTDWQPVLRAAAVLRDYALHSHEAQLARALQGASVTDACQAALILGGAMRALLLRILDSHIRLSSTGGSTTSDGPPPGIPTTQDDLWAAVADVRAARRTLMTIAADRLLAETDLSDNATAMNTFDSVTQQRAIDELLAHPALATRPALLEAVYSALNSTSLRLLVLGNFKRGKSTLINALVGARILPARMTPATAVLCTLHHAATLDITVSYVDQRPARAVSLPELEDYVCLPDPASLPATADDADGATRQFRPEIEAVRIGLPWPFLRDGVEIIDSPGLNEATDRQARAWAALDAADIVIYVLSATEPLAADEEATIADKLWSAGHRSMLFVVNYVNRVDDEELPLIQERFATLLAPYSSPTSPPPLFFVAARPALLARERGHVDALQASGLPALEKALARYTAGAGRQAVLRRSQLRCLWGGVGHMIEDEAVATISTALAMLVRHTEDQRLLTAQIASLEAALAVAESDAALHRDTILIEQATRRRLLEAVRANVSAAVEQQSRQQSLTWLHWEMPIWLTEQINKQISHLGIASTPEISPPPVAAMRDRSTLLVHYHAEVQRVLTLPSPSPDLAAGVEDQTVRRARQSLEVARSQRDAIHKQIAELHTTVRQTLAEAAALDQAIALAIHPS